MGCVSDTSKLCTMLILTAINCVLLAGGVVVLIGSMDAKDSGWLDVASEYWSSADSLLTALEIVGSVIIGLAVLGSIAACFRWRAGLLVYACVVLIVLIAFVVVAGVAFTARNTAQDWTDKSYPADTHETSMKSEFDRAYCYAQGAYICNEMNVTEAASLFYPSMSNSSLLAPFSDLKGVNSMCSSFLTFVPVLQSVCDGCAAAKLADNFTAVLDWANDECPRTANTLLWCGTYLGSSNKTSVIVGTAPYTQCRAEFLDLVSSSALMLGVGSAIIAGGSLLVILFSCYLRRKERHGRQEYDGGAYGTPQTSTPQTSEPLYGTQRPNDQLYSKV